jgi:hypothetical protein
MSASTVELMWIGSATYDAGVAGWASLYCFADNADLGAAAGHRLFAAIGCLAPRLVLSGTGPTVAT